MLQSCIQDVADEVNKMPNSRKEGFVNETMNCTKQISIIVCGWCYQIFKWLLKDFNFILLSLAAIVSCAYISVIINRKTLGLTIALIKVNISFVNMQSNWALQKTKYYQNRRSISLLFNGMSISIPFVNDLKSI